MMKGPPTEAALKPLQVGERPPLHMLVEGFSVFGMQVQYWMLIAAMVVVVAIVIGLRK
jgi:hypothetical protein